MSTKAVPTHRLGTMISVESEKIAVSDVLKGNEVGLKKIGHVDNESQ